MNKELRTKLHAIRERITKSFNACDACDKAIEAIRGNLAAVEAGAEQSEVIAAAIPAIRAMAAAKIAEHEETKCCFDDQFGDVVK